MKKNLSLQFYSIISLFMLFFTAGLCFGQDFYWENPKKIIPDNVWFPVTASTDKTGFILWQEYTDNTGKVWFSIITTDDGVIFTQNRRVIGPFPVTGDKIPMASLAADRRGNIYVAISASGTGISIYRSTDSGKSFTLLGNAGGDSNNTPTVAPKLFITGKGRFLLFTTQPLAQRAVIGTPGGVLGITYSVSENGVSWSAFKPFVSSPGLSNIYLPFAVSMGNREHVVFQASPAESRFYQLYYTYSDNGGFTWSTPVRITTMDEEGQSSNNFDNQRPFLAVNGKDIYLTWERKLGVRSSMPYFGKIDIRKKTIVDMELIEGTDISTNPVNNPQITFVDHNPVVIWYNNIGRIVMVHKPGAVWQNIDIAGQRKGGINSFGRFLVLSVGLNVIWQSSLEDHSELLLLTPDRTVPTLTLYPKNFKADRANRKDTFVISWNLPSDSSGIAGFSYHVDKISGGTAPERVIIKRRDPRTAEATLSEDGRWFFHVRATDYAGNWSEPAHISFIRDTTPPEKVSFIQPQLDDNGFMVSNTGVIEWNPSREEKVSGYSYHVQYLASSSFNGDITGFNIIGTPDVPQSTDTFYRFNNKDNGLWALTVSAFDEVGNKSESATYYFKLNKYIPVTYITKIQALQDELGNINIDIYGRGFQVGGTISAVILDKDRVKPYDYIYYRNTSSYTVKTDRIIAGLSIEDMEQGSYFVGLIHPARGLYFNKTKLSFDSTGAVKFGNFSILDGKERYNRAFQRFFALSVNSVTLLLVMLFLAFMFIAATFKIVNLVREGNILKEEAHALLHNEELPSEKKRERIMIMKKRGMGLRIKFALLITFLVLIIVLMVAYPLSVFMIKTQQRNLTESLNQTTKVLISSIKTSAAKYLQENNTLELKRLPAQIESMKAAKFLTITGPGIRKSSSRINDYIWVTNDKLIENKIDSESFKENKDDPAALLPGGEKFFEGSLYMKDDLSQGIAKMAADIDKKGRESVGKLTAELAKLQETAAKATRTARTENDIENIRRMQDEISLLSTSIEKKLAEIGDRFGSVPPFDPDRILTGEMEYTFYTPIVYQVRGNDEEYYQGTVRLGISTKDIINEIKKSRNLLLNRTVFIALIAIGLGIVGSLVLATIIIIPINHLLTKVKEISSTDDHSSLKNFQVEVKTKDEISDLAEAVNVMAHGLYVAAEAKKELTVGKEIQKRFIPLEMGKDGSKLSTGSKFTDYVDFFGYYEGAKGVSGDYFDFIEIEPDNFAVIKCDIAGKGVSASLIMVEVATIFHNYFNEWKKEQQRRKIISVQKKIPYRSTKPKIAELVYSINSLVEEMGFKGRFAALIVALIDTKTGRTIFCNAGDNLVHLYKSSKRKMEIVTLPEAPACGVFPNDLVEMQSGFQGVPYQLEHGDILFLFTDGVEEAQRVFRDVQFNRIKCEEPGLKEGDFHDTHPFGNETEELGIPRLQQIIRAVLVGETYQLHKYHNPVKNETLVFDFSACKGTAEEAVLAMVAVEKIFRIYPDPSAGPMDRVSVDVKIHQFLKEHFLQYNKYFRNQLENSDEENYLIFTHLKEDAQYDDLTVLGIKRK